jgi:hypothetical protein
MGGIRPDAVELIEFVKKLKDEVETWLEESHPKQHNTDKLQFRTDSPLWEYPTNHTPILEAAIYSTTGSTLIFDQEKTTSIASAKRFDLDGTVSL